ncbi:MAG TPA: copper resistance protein CopC [Gaiella sp.]|nr:copper resistance protein CopC [Gaiella sp.]
MRRLAGRLGIVGAASVALVLSSAAPAFAHATLEGTEPTRGSVVEAQPKAVVFHYSEAVEMNFSSVHVYDATGDVVDDGAPVHPGGVTSDVAIGLQPDLAHGTYTATYRVISADGHPVSGGFLFSVGEAGAAPTRTVAELAGAASSGRGTTSAFAVARAVQYGAIALAVGAFVFLVMPWLGGLRAVAGAGRDWQETSESFVSRTGVVFAIAVVAGLVSGGAGIVLQGQTAAGGSLVDAMRWSVVRQVFETHFGSIWGARLLVWLAFGGTVLLAYRRKTMPVMQPAAAGSTGLALPRGLGSSRYLGGMLVLLSLLALSPAFAGHADAQSPTALLLPSTTLHVVAMSAWIGGLAILVFVLRGAMRPLDLVQRGRLLASVLARFSTIAGVCVAVVLLTGIVQSFVYVRNLDNLLHTEFGQILIAKILVVVGMLGIGGYNRQRSVPRLLKIADGGETPGRAGVLLRRALRGEVLLAVVVLGLTGALTGFAPATATSTTAGPFATTEMIGPAQIQLTVEPARVGANLIHLYLLDPKTGAQWDRAKEVRIKLVQPDKNIELDATTRKGGPGHYVVDAALLSSDGTWEVRVNARVSEFDEYATMIAVPVSKP